MTRTKETISVPTNQKNETAQGLGSRTVVRTVTTVAHENAKKWKSATVHRGSDATVVRWWRIPQVHSSLHRSQPKATSTDDVYGTSSSSVSINKMDGDFMEKKDQVIIVYEHKINRWSKVNSQEFPTTCDYVWQKFRKQNHVTCIEQYNMLCDYTAIANVNWLKLTCLDFHVWNTSCPAYYFSNAHAVKFDFN